MMPSPVYIEAQIYIHSHTHTCAIFVVLSPWCIFIARIKAHTAVCSKVGWSISEEEEVVVAVVVEEERVLKEGEEVMDGAVVGTGTVTEALNAEKDVAVAPPPSFPPLPG